jgi:hypothetical protein
MVEKPIACTLEAGAARAQLDAWQELLAGTIERRDRVATGRLELVLSSGFDQVDALVRLAQRETTCCAFFTFSVAISAEALTLVIEAPDDAAAVLDDFANTVGPA